MRTLVAASLLALSLTPTVAQVSVGGGRESSGKQKEYEQQLKDQAEIDKKYQATIKQTGKGVAAPTLDPWANVRSAPESKPATQTKAAVEPKPADKPKRRKATPAQAEAR